MKFNNKTVNAIFISILLIMLLTSSSCSIQESNKTSSCKKRKESMTDLTSSDVKCKPDDFYEPATEYKPVPEYKPNYCEKPAVISPYDGLFEDNMLSLSNPVEPNSSIYGQNNLIDFFDTNNDSVPMRYRAPHQETEKVEYIPSETILNVDDNKYSVSASQTGSDFKLEGYSPDDYAPFLISS